MRAQKHGANINSTINVSTIDGACASAGETGAHQATNMSTIASLTGSRPKHSTLHLSNNLATMNVPTYIPSLRHLSINNPYSSLSPSRQMGDYRVRGDGKRVGSTSLLNTSSLIHYNHQ